MNVTTILKRNSRNIYRASKAKTCTSTQSTTVRRILGRNICWKKPIVPVRSRPPRLNTMISAMVNIDCNIKPRVKPKLKTLTSIWGNIPNSAAYFYINSIIDITNRMKSATVNIQTYQILPLAKKNTEI